jgi:hypothetical protein
MDTENIQVGSLMELQQGPELPSTDLEWKNFQQSYVEV